MASFEALLTAPIEWRAEDEQTNAQAQAIQAAPGADEELIVEAITVSASAAPAASVMVTLDTEDGARVLWKGRLPNAAFVPLEIPFKKVLVGNKGKNVRLTLPALGAGVVGHAQVRGITRKAN
jgi:hypothetical protein